MIRHAGLIAQRVGGRWLGVLVEGPSGAGKTTLALRALAQGFRLVADDRVALWRSRGGVYGRAPAPLHGLIEMRGYDVVRVEALPLAEVGLIARLGAPERIPDPAAEDLLGCAVPVLEVAADDLAAAAKLSRALASFDAGRKRRI